MAKPIPFNRRWLQNQQAQGNAATPDPDAAPLPVDVPPAVREARENLIARIREVLFSPEPDEEFDPVALVRAYLHEMPLDAGAVIPARYASQCPGCGEPIRVGEPITRHPQWGRYVHAHCRNRQQRVASIIAIIARYGGVCRRCQQPIHPGERIVQQRGFGWVHEACAQQRERDS